MFQFIIILAIIGCLILLGYLIADHLKTYKINRTKTELFHRNKTDSQKDIETDGLSPENETIVDKISSMNDDNRYENESDVPYEEYQTYLASITPETLQNETVIPRKLTSTERFFLRAIKNKSVKNLSVAAHWYYTYNLNIRETIALYLKTNHLQIQDGMSLERYTIPKLKEILIKKSLPKMGKKQELIDRILEHFTTEELQAICGDDLLFYQLTEKGWDVVNSLVDSATYNLELEDECIKLILDEQYDKAYRKVCMFRLNSRLPSVLSFDWSVAMQRGWNKKHLDKSNDKLMYYSACSIFCEMMGLSYSKSNSLYQRLTGEPWNPVEEVPITLWHYYESNARELADYKASGIKQYQILVSCDVNTCKKCAQMDGKIFDVAEAIIGINAPPFEETCRCTTTAVIDGIDNTNDMRSVRDENGKSIQVPYMTYEEWSKKYAPEKHQEYFC